MCLQDVAGGSNSDATKSQLLYLWQVKSVLSWSARVRANTAKYPPDVGGSFWPSTTYTQFRDRAIYF